jgi:anti-sigma regulatory factor (Ser/Thr protein kinase)
MRQPEPQLARLSEPDLGELELGSPTLAPFRHLSERAPFPRANGNGARYGPRIEVELDSGPDAAAEARAAIGVLDRDADADALDDLRLLVSEVVTNSVRHAGAPGSAKIGLAVSVVDDVVRAEVTDGGPGFQPSPRDAPELEAGGWGLHLVDRLASRWGVERGRPARVWFEVEPA